MILALILFFILCLIKSTIEATISGTFFSFCFSKCNKPVSFTLLFAIMIIFLIFEKTLLWTIVASLDLRLTTGNQEVISLLKTDDLSNNLKPSFSFFDIVYYLISASIGSFFGRLIIKTKYNKTPNQSYKRDPEQSCDLSKDLMSNKDYR